MSVAGAMLRLVAGGPGVQDSLGLVLVALAALQEVCTGLTSGAGNLGGAPLS